MKWINNYHKGFNRVWLVISVIGAFLFVFYLVDEGEYRVGGKPNLYAILNNLPSNYYEWTSQDHEQYRTASTREYTEQDWARYWKAEEIYSSKIWNTRFLSVVHLLLVFLITFAIGHGCFYLVVWMIRGFTTGVGVSPTSPTLREILQPVVRFVKFHFAPKGRLNRKSYFVVVLFAYGIAFSFCLLVYGHLNIATIVEEDLGAFGGICLLLWLWTLSVNTIKRLHDMNLSGAWLLIPTFFFFASTFTISTITFAIFAVVSIVFYAVTLCFLFCKKGTAGQNRFGPNPRTTPVFRTLRGL